MRASLGLATPPPSPLTTSNFVGRAGEMDSKLAGGRWGIKNSQRCSYVFLILIKE